jgi:uncharacterized protein (TIGR01244 family)
MRAQSRRCPKDLAMKIPLVVKKCSLPVYDKVCFDLGAQFVTAQPIWRGKNSPYAAIAKAGVRTVLCARDPQEVTADPNPFDIAEASELVLQGVAYTNVPLPHISMTQAAFNRQAADANAVINTAQAPVLIHCSTGDRASAAFAVHLVLRYGVPNKDAVRFAKTKLALQNQQFVEWVLGFSAP